MSRSQPPIRRGPRPRSRHGDNATRPRAFGPGGPSDGSASSRAARPATPARLPERGAGLLQSSWWPVSSALGAAGCVALAVLVAAGGGGNSLDRTLGSIAALPATGQDAATAVVGAESAWVGTVAVVLAAAVVWWRTATLLMPVALLGSWAGTASLVYVLDIAFGRSRPVGSGVLGAPLLQGSFPSGHTATETVLVGLVAIMTASTVGSALVRTLTLASGVVLAAVLGISALTADQVWSTDVLAGWLLGATVAATVTTALGSWFAAPDTGTETVSNDDTVAAPPGPPTAGGPAGTGEPRAAGTRGRTTLQPAGPARRPRPRWKR